MIFLRKHNLLFLKPRKVAGTSFEIALSRYAGPQDIVTAISPDDEAERRRRGYQGKANFRYPVHELTRAMIKPVAKELRYPYKFYNHITAAEARERLGADVFDAAFKVSIVRDPADMLVSYYFHSGPGDPDPRAFAEWARKNPAFANINETQYFIDGEFVIDHMLRFENFAEDIAALEDRFSDLAGLAGEFAGVAAKSGHRPKGQDAATFYAGAEALSETLAYLAAPIYERFGYSPPGRLQ